jgi:hypothetical protein
MPRHFFSLGCDAEIFAFEPAKDAPDLCADCLFIAEWIEDLIGDSRPPVRDSVADTDQPGAAP